MVNIPKEYETSFDFGFTAVDSEESITEKSVVNTQEIVQPMTEDLDYIKKYLVTLNGKIENLEDMITAGAGSSNFDVDEYKTLVAKDVGEKLAALEKMVVPLLYNLMKNPEKDYIKWPNRKPIIESQIQKILEITRG
jgi:hypothetical protein